jgi:hypothetical protein
MNFFDIEIFPNYALFGFMDEKGKVKQYETFDKFKPKQIKKIEKILNGLVVGFNSINYDMPIIEYALKGATVEKMYKASQSIVNDGVKPYTLYRMMGIKKNWDYDHIDLMEQSPGVGVGLKLYGTRLGSEKLWEYEADFDKPIKKKELANVRGYNVNDLVTTSDLYHATKDRIELREKMSKQYGMDLRSKSDAQIAEAVIVSELGGNVASADIHSDYTFKYDPPSYVKFETKQLKDVFKMIKGTTFVLDGKGSPQKPDTFKPITIGSTTYEIGIGGLHSQEKNLTVEADDDFVVRNADYASYYPYIILNNKLYPEHLGKKFLKIYRKIVETRIAAKKSGDKLTADSLKITINGSFGKYGSKYSKLYSPKLLLQTTITGQLTLLMLIEKFESEGISVISANTDGLEYLCKRSDVDLAEGIIYDLDLETGYEMEHGEYQGLYARDVSNYIAKYNGYVKSKGVYGESSLNKNIQTPICFEAVREFINNGTPIKKTIKKCKDIKQFISARKVTGGGKWNDEYLGKVVRWYYSTKGSPIHYVKANKHGTHNKVPLTDAAKPMMDLTKKIPKDLDYNWYIQYAKRMLGDVWDKYQPSNEEIFKEAVEKAGSIEDLYIKELGYKKVMTKLSNASINKMKKYLYG